MGFRDYSPGLNRFLTRDMYNGALADLKLGTDPWNTNRYAFAGGNPITGIELDGHCVPNETTNRCESESQPVRTVSSKPPGLTDVAVDRDVATTQPVAPHPDRMFEMAGCNGGPGCVMPEGSVGKYGPYRPKPGEWVAETLALAWIPVPFAARLLALARLAKIARQTERGTEAAAKTAAGLAESGFVNPSAVRFSQNSISAAFKNGGSVKGLAADLRSGAVNPSDIPAIRLVERNGNYFTLDNRRLAAFQEAGIDVPYRMATPQEIAREGWKFTTTNDGTSILIRGGG